MGSLPGLYRTSSPPRIAPAFVLPRLGCHLLLGFRPSETAEPNISSSADSFSSAFRPPKLPSEINPPPADEVPSQASSRIFFRGHFAWRGLPGYSCRIAAAVEPLRKNPWENLRRCSIRRAPEEPSPAAGVAGNESPGAGFTGWFNNPNIASRTSGTAGAPPSGGLPRPVADDSSAFPAPRTGTFRSAATCVVCQLRHRPLSHFRPRRFSRFLHFQIR